MQQKTKEFHSSHGCPLILLISCATLLCFWITFPNKWHPAAKTLTPTSDKPSLIEFRDQPPGSDCSQDNRQNRMIMWATCLGYRSRNTPNYVLHTIMRVLLCVPCFPSSILYAFNVGSLDPLHNVYRGLFPRIRTRFLRPGWFPCRLSFHHVPFSHPSSSAGARSSVLA